MADIGVVIRPGVEEAVALARELQKWCAANGHTFVAEDASARLIGNKSSLSQEDLVKAADPIVTLGGDGTLIGVARYVGAKNPVLLGVNFGTLGFLTEIRPSELLDTLAELFAGKARIGRRSMLHCECVRDGKVIFSSQAVNDVVVQKGVREKLIEFDLSANEEHVMRVRADGLILATPTGSTAYSLSAGGPIVYPLLEVMIISPICPHSLTYRPFVLPLDRSLEIALPGFKGKVFLTVDGQVSLQLCEGDLVRVKRAINDVAFVHSSKRSYFDILRGKLNWGASNKFE